MVAKKTEGRVEVAPNERFETIRGGRQHERHGRVDAKAEVRGNVGTGAKDCTDACERDEDEGNVHRSRIDRTHADSIMAGQKSKRKSKSGRKKVKTKGTASERVEEEFLDVQEEQGSDDSNASQPLGKETGPVDANEETKAKGTTPTPTNSPTNTPVSSPTRTAATSAHLTADQSPAKTPEKKIENTPVNSPSKSPFRNLFRNLVRSPAKTAAADDTKEDTADKEENAKVEQPIEAETDVVTSVDAEDVVQSSVPASPSRAQGDAENPETPELQPDARQPNPSTMSQSLSKMSDSVLEATPKTESKVADIAPTPEAITTESEKVSSAVDPDPTESNVRDTTIQLESSRKCGCTIC